MKKFACLILCLSVLPMGGFAPPAVRWVDFAADEGTLRTCLQYAVELHESLPAYRFADAVAYLAAKNGNRFSQKTDRKHLDAYVAELRAGKTADELMPSSAYAAQLRTSYAAVLTPLVGAYIDEQTGEKGFGLCCPFPLAAGYWYNHYDDFGNARSYGYRRRHLGHDIMGSIGTPIVAVEGGTVTECGWNRYGGWRIGIRSDDTLRYYYYAHMCKDRPFAAAMEVGARVQTGQVIGYLGVTGYSSRENTNLPACRPHLHFGLQLIFAPEQEKGAGEIWIDLYALCNFLSAYRVRTETGETGDKVSIRRRIPAEEAPSAAQ